MAELVGNLLLGQSGGPTAVINASLAGVLQEASKHECIEEIYGGLNGILGILNEELIDINEQKAKTIDGLRFTPAAALGTCRYKIDFKKKPGRTWIASSKFSRRTTSASFFTSAEMIPRTPPTKSISKPSNAAGTCA